jgi:hypothetical protein
MTNSEFSPGFRGMVVLLNWRSAKTRTGGDTAREFFRRWSRRFAAKKARQ